MSASSVLLPRTSPNGTASPSEALLEPRTAHLSPCSDSGTSEMAGTEFAGLLGHAGSPQGTLDLHAEGSFAFSRCGSWACLPEPTTPGALRLRRWGIISAVSGVLVVFCLLAAPSLWRISSSSPITWSRLQSAFHRHKVEDGVNPVDTGLRGSWAVAAHPVGDPRLSLTGTRAAPEEDLCNVSARLPWIEPVRNWQLGPIWRSMCEAKNLHDDVPEGRNWCWVGMKRNCHWNLKAHFTWAELQEKAAKSGMAPPVSDAPFDPLEHPQVCDRPELGVRKQYDMAEKVAAREWFNRYVKVYVLNLETDRERWKMISARLKFLDINATRISGIDMRVSGALALAKDRGWVPQEFNFSHAQKVAYLPKMAMGSILGTLGCASAHFKAQETILRDGAPMGLVLEDDSWPADDFVPRLWSLLRHELPCDWNIVALYSRCPYGSCISPHLARVQPDTNEPEWRCRQGVNWGMHAILYRASTLRKVQKVWKRTVFDEERPRCMDVDVALASISDQVGYYAVPNVQEPGFVVESNHRSARWDINQAAITTTTSTSTSFVYVPRIKPGEPWPGAWHFG